MFLEALDKLLTDRCSAAAVRRLESGGPAAEVWQPIAQAGFLDLMRGEAHGGGGLGLREMFPVFECLGHHGAPLPIAQTIVARGLVPDLPDRIVTIATQARRSDIGVLQCLQVPGGMVAGLVLVCDGDQALLLDIAGAYCEPVGDHRSLVANLTWAAQAAASRCDVDSRQLEALMAAATAAMLSGAMQRAFEMTLAQCNDRVQFGRSIGKFQAVQHQVSRMAEHVLAASIAAEAALRGDGAAPTLLAAAMAKSRSSEAAGLVAGIAHAVHGAIGMTDAFDLSILTRRLHEWRVQYGAETVWNRRIGAEVLSGDATLADFVRSA